MLDPGSPWRLHAPGILYFFSTIAINYLAYLTSCSTRKSCYLSSYRATSDIEISLVCLWMPGVDEQEFQLPHLARMSSLQTMVHSSIGQCAVHNDVVQKGIRFHSISTPGDPPIPSISKAIELGLMTSIPDDWEFQLPGPSSLPSRVAGSFTEYSFEQDPLSCAPPAASTSSSAPFIVSSSNPTSKDQTDTSARLHNDLASPPAVDAHTALELRTHNMRVEIQKTMGQNKATDAAYTRHVKSYFDYWPKFQQTCIENGEPTLPAEPITVARAAVFLKHETERKRRKAFTGQEIDNSSIGDKTIEQIINALEDFRKKNQHRLEYRDCPEAKIPLRSDPRIKIFEKQSRAERPQRVNDSHEMKAHGMTEATYKEAQLIKLSMRTIYAFKGDNSIQAMPSRKLATALRDRAMILLSCSTAFRGDSSRILQLSDLELYQLRLIEQGYDVYIPCPVFTANQGKTNTDGNLEHHGCVRHRLPELCCVGGLGFHLYGVFHLQKKPIPDFSVEPNFGAFGRRKWYGLHLFPGGKSDYEPLSYDAHLKRIKAIHDESGLSLKNATHAGRHYVGETAMYAGASQEGVLQLGQWTSMNAGSAPRYMQSLPVDAILAMGGWNGRDQNSYNLIRGKLDVPPSLSSLIFPWIEVELHKLEAQKTKYGPERGDDHRLRLLLDLLKFLRTVIIQDAVVLFFEYPKCPLWQYEPFNSVMFRSFAAQARTVLKNAELASQVQLQNLPRDIANMFHGTMGTYNTETIMLRGQVQRLEETLQSISETLGTRTEKPAKRAREQEVQEMSKRRKIPSQETALTNGASQAVLNLAVSVDNNYSETQSGSSIQVPASTTVGSSNVISRSGETYGSSVFSLNGDNCPTRDAQLDHIAVLEALYKPSQLRNHRFVWSESRRRWIPQYEFYLPPNGLILSILDIWTEFTEGIDGRLSVESLEKTWGTEWRKAQGSMRTEMSKRLKVVNLIKKLVMLEGWDKNRALSFLKEHYVPTKKYPTAKSFIAALQDSKKGDEAKAKEKCKIKAEDIIDFARTIS